MPPRDNAAGPDGQQCPQRDRHAPPDLASHHFEEVIENTVDDNSDARRSFWAGRIDALRPVVERGIARGELRPDIDARLLLETLIAPVHGRLLLTGGQIDAELAERAVDLVLDGARSSESSNGKLRNRRPSGKTSPRRRRRLRGGVAVEE